MEVMTAREKRRVEREVEEQFERFVVSVNEMKAQAWSDFYSDEFFLSAIAGTGYYGSKKVWVGVIWDYFTAREYQHITPITISVNALTPDFALMTSQENAVMRLKGGGGGAIKHSFTMLWKKERQGWKILHSHESWSKD